MIGASDLAEFRCEVVHFEAVGAKGVGGGGVCAHVARGDRRCVGEARENGEAAGGDFAAVFGAGVVAVGKREGQQLDEAGGRFGLESPERLFFAG